MDRQVARFLTLVGERNSCQVARSRKEKVNAGVCYPKATVGAIAIAPWPPCEYPVTYRLPFN